MYLQEYPIFQDMTTFERSTTGLELDMDLKSRWCIWDDIFKWRRV